MGSDGGVIANCSQVTKVKHMVRRGCNTVPEVVCVDKVSWGVGCCDQLVELNVWWFGTVCLQNCSVTGILILHGLPYDLTAQVIAHEATHSFIKLSDNFPEHLPMMVRCEQVHEPNECDS